MGANWADRWLRWLEFWLPQRCVICQQNSRRALCEGCLVALPREGVERQPPEFCDALWVVGHYAAPLDELVQALKYREQWSYGRWLGELMAAEFGPHAPEVAGVVPMPLHPSRLKKRGFNQASELAKPIARALQAKVRYQWLIRERDTPSQVGQNREQRQHNLRGAFRATGDVRGQRILLVDDVMTTGSTLSEAARTLKASGAAWVGAAVLCRAGYADRSTAEEAVENPAL